MTTTTPRPLVELPKAHLHVHLEGAMRPSTLYELCESQGTPVPTIAARYTSFADFQKLYITARAAIRSVDDLVRLVTEVVEDAAADGAVWIEPAIHLRGHATLGPDEFVLDTLIEAGRRASAVTGVGVGWLISTDRTLPPERAIEQATVAARYAGKGVVSMGLANDEAPGRRNPSAPPSTSPGRPASSVPPTPASTVVPILSGAHSTLSGPIASSTESGPPKTPLCSIGWPTTRSASTSARRPMSPWPSWMASMPIPSRTSSTPACPAASTPTTRFSSASVCSTSTCCVGNVSVSTTPRWRRAHAPPSTTAARPTT